VDVGDTFDQKVEAVRCYRSQFDDARWKKLHHFLVGYNTYHGTRCGFQYGEPFYLPHPVGAADLFAVAHGGKGSPAPVQLPELGQEPPPVAGGVAT